jgi:hypothetical protein
MAIHSFRIVDETGYLLLVMVENAAVCASDFFSNL